MGTKVKRTPLFGQDGNLGVPILARTQKVIMMILSDKGPVCKT